MVWHLELLAARSAGNASSLGAPGSKMHAIVSRRLWGAPRHPPTANLCESDPLAGGRAQTGSELDPWNRGSDPNGKPQQMNVPLRVRPLGGRTRSNWKRPRPMESREQPQRQTPKNESFFQGRHDFHRVDLNGLLKLP